MADRFKRLWVALGRALEAAIEAEHAHEAAARTLHAGWEARNRCERRGVELNELRERVLSREIEQLRATLQKLEGSDE